MTAAGFTHNRSSRPRPALLCEAMRCPAVILGLLVLLIPAPPEEKTIKRQRGDKGKIHSHWEGASLPPEPTALPSNQLGFPQECQNRMCSLFFPNTVLTREALGCFHPQVLPHIFRLQGLGSISDEDVVARLFHPGRTTSTYGRRS